VRALWELGRLALSNLLRRPLRTLLTVLGIAIGMTAVVALLSLSGGLERALTAEFERLGHDVVLLLPASPGAPRGALGGAERIDLSALEALPGVASVGALLRRTLPVAAGDTQGFLVVLGVYPNVSSAARFTGRFELASGREPAPDREEALLTERASRDLGVEPGEEIRIARRPFRVSGVLRPTGDANTEGAIFVPLEALWELTDGRRLVSLAWVRAAPNVEVEQLAVTIEERLRAAGARFGVQTAKRLGDVVQTALRVLKGTLTGIAAVALFVGSVGLMNTMYTAVLERTREIGILAALGARPGQIALLFVLEAGMLGLIGGLIGLLFGIGLALSIASLVARGAGTAGLSPVVSPGLVGLALLISMGLGVLAGWLPARRAAALSPVDALRYE
jgi:putative ABC transport system permease protein